DHGKLTDHHGKTVDFRNAILIMTTNAGASDMARESIGFGAGSREDAQEDAVKKMFTPEFRNRLDAIVPFSYLPPAVVARKVAKGKAAAKPKADKAPAKKKAGGTAPAAE